MGDMADYYRERELDAMAFGGTRFEEEEEYVDTVACKYCKEPGLHWEEIDGKWRLCDFEDSVHRCEIQTETWPIR